jgi:hypothetical protein
MILIRITTLYMPRSQRPQRPETGNAVRFGNSLAIKFVGLGPVACGAPDAPPQAAAQAPEPSLDTVLQVFSTYEQLAAGLSGGFEGNGVAEALTGDAMAMLAIASEVTSPPSHVSWESRLPPALHQPWRAVTRLR